MTTLERRLERQIHDLRTCNIEELLGILAAKAQKREGGHYAVFRFTTGYKVAFGTPNLDSGQGREDVLYTPAYPTLKDAIIGALLTWETFGQRRSAHVH